MLFVGGVAVPFIAQAVMAGLGTVLISQLTVGKPVEVSASTGVRTNIVDEARWLWRNPPIRTLTVVLVDLTFCALWHMFALSTVPATSMTILFAFGFQGPIWAATATGVRQRSASGPYPRICRVESAAFTAWVFSEDLSSEIFSARSSLESGAC